MSAASKSDDGANDDTSARARLDTELSLLHAMYPSQLAFDPGSRHLVYSSPALPSPSSRASRGSQASRPSAREQGVSLTLRVPDGYPSSTQRVAVVAASAGRRDVRDAVAAHVADAPAGEEVLDAVLAAFLECAAAAAAAEDEDEDEEGDQEAPSAAATAAAAAPAAAPALDAGGAKKTVVVWLHHLLAPSKRKHALHPSAPRVTGVTKPGYPGVLVFSGPRDGVDEHVRALKQLKWQAFQVRLEEDEEWVFGPGAGGAGGVREVESLSEVVQLLGEERREAFLKAVRKTG